MILGDERLRTIVELAGAVAARHHTPIAQALLFSVSVATRWRLVPSNDRPSAAADVIDPSDPERYRAFTKLAGRPAIYQSTPRATSFMTS